MTDKKSPLYLDVETQSLADLTKVGAYVYAMHPSTRMLCCVYKLHGKNYAWIPAMNDLQALILGGMLPGLPIHGGASLPPILGQALEGGHPFVAFNSPFETCIWVHTLKQKEPARWFDAQAICATNGLPQSLQDASLALGFGSKDAEGKKLMLKLCKPNNKGHLAEPTVGEYLALLKYNVQDVELTEKITLWGKGTLGANRTWNENRVWTMHDRVNRRGITVDTQLVQATREMAARVKVDIQAQFEHETGLKAADMTRVAYLKGWMAEQGVVMESIDTDAIDLKLKEPLPNKVRSMLSLKQQASRASLAKLESLARVTCPDGRMRGMLRYNGYNTGRWSARGFPLHNIAKTILKRDEVERCINAVLTGDLDALKAAARGNAYEGLVACLRPCLRAGPGKTLVMCDYNAIQARIVLWLAGDEYHMDWWRTRDIYSEMATRLFNRPISKANPVERDFGKRTILSCNFQVGPPTFEENCAAEGIDLRAIGLTAEQVIKAFRREFTSLSDYDNGLWANYTRAGVETLETNQAVTTNRVTFEPGPDRTLQVWMPSGRRLVYRNARLRWNAKHETNEVVCDTPETAGDHFYGGKWADNFAQAIERDLLASSLLDCEAAGLDVPLHVHDEIVAECDTAAIRDTQEKLERIMLTAPTWAAGLPIKVESFVTERYQK